MSQNTTLEELFASSQNADGTDPYEIERELDTSLSTPQGFFEDEEVNNSAEAEQNVYHRATSPIEEAKADPWSSSFDASTLYNYPAPVAREDQKSYYWGKVCASTSRERPKPN